MSTSTLSARDNRQSVQFFDIDLFRNKLESFQRKQASEMCQAVNTKKRKLDDRWSDTEKQEMELAEDMDSRDHLVWQFSKRPRGDSYYPIDDDELEMEEVSPLTLPSPVSTFEGEASRPWPFFDSIDNHMQPEEDESYMSLAMRRQLTGYSEVSTTSTSAYAFMEHASDDDEWMSPCPALSRPSVSSISSNNSTMPQTPTANADDDDLMVDTADLELDLDIAAMAPYERKLLANLAPEKFEKAQLIKKAFRQSEKLLDQFARDSEVNTANVEGEVQMDDGEYDLVFGELMQISQVSPPGR